MSSLQERAIMIRLMRKMWGASKSDKKLAMTISSQMHAQHGNMTVNKKIAHSDFLSEYKKIGDAAWDDLKEITVPWTDDKWRLLPSVKFEGVMQELRKKKTLAENALANFIEDYPDAIRRARADLADAFKENDYPHVDMLPAKFSFDWELMQIPSSVVADFRVALGEGQKEELAENLRQQMADAHQNGIRDLMTRLYKQIEYIHGRLDLPSGGVREKMMDNLNGVLDILPDLNIFDDPDLADFAVEIKRKIIRNPNTELAHDYDERAAVKESAADIMSRMNKFGVGEPLPTPPIEAEVEAA